MLALIESPSSWEHKSELYETAKKEAALKHSISSRVGRESERTYNCHGLISQAELLIPKVMV
jgi:hypothetical protein